MEVKKSEDKYHQKRLKVLSPDRKDPLQFMYQKGEASPNEDDTYKGRMLRQQLENEHLELNRKIAQQRENQLKKIEDGKRLHRSPKRDGQQSTSQSEWEHIDKQEKLIKTDVQTQFSQKQTQQQKEQEQQSSQQQSSSRFQVSSLQQQQQGTPGSLSLQRKSRWDQTPVNNYDATPGRNMMMETPTPGRQMVQDGNTVGGATPTPRRVGKSKWDKTPLNLGQQTPNQFQGYTPTPGQMLTPNAQAVMGLQGMSHEQIKQLQLQKEIDDRNQYLTDEDLDAILPSKGYEVVKQPEGYKPVKHENHTKLTSQSGMSTPQSYYNVPESAHTYLNQMMNIQQTPLSMQSNALPNIKPEDVGYFGALLNEVRDEELTLNEQKERKIMMLLLKIKNGTPPMRKSALRQITINARDFGAGPLFNQILPLLMSPTLDEQERHLLVKVIDRILYKLDDMVRPYVHKILVVIEPLLIDEDYYARVEGREIISNLSKAAGLATMISTMRPDIDHQDEYVRNTTARAFAVVASALGVPTLLPFLKAVCNSKKSWQARHTGIKIIQQIAILMGCAILPHLKSIVDIITNGLKDQQQKVKTITSLALAALAEASTPYGIEAFYQVLIPLWHGIKQQRGKSLAAYLKAIGFIIPLMENQQASDYTKMIMPILKREFQNNEEEMKKIILKVLKQCLSSEGIKPQYIRENIVQEFFRNYWIRRNALDKRNYKQLVETTVEIGRKIGGGEIIQMIVDDLKDDSEQYRKMVMETIEKIVIEMGVSDVGNRLEIQLMDGILHGFQEQSEEQQGSPANNVMLNGFGAVIVALGQRAKPYFSQICGIIQWRLNNKSNKVRQQAADLICRIALSMKNCNEEARLGRLGVLLYECLGEEYPEVLGSLLAALKAIVNVIGMSKMTPPIKDLLPRLTPILKNRHEKVQENTIDLVGRIADRGSEYVSPKEWIRICFDLLDLLKAHKKGIRRATVNTFGFIAKAIGPQDVLVTLLNNLKVQERQNRVCTTVAIAIICETCGPYTVLPGLMNEYRVQELNVQNGVLKSLSFMFEYVGEMGKDYIYAITPLLEDALTDRDLVHRQTAASAVKHLALGVQGLGCEDALIHLLNFVWPNIFETSPHVVNAINEAVEGLRVSLGAGILQQYILQGLFHPAKRVRIVYWRFYNMLYVNSQDQMLPYFPQLNLLKDPQQDTSIYLRNELYNLI